MRLCKKALLCLVCAVSTAVGCSQKKEAVPEDPILLTIAVPESEWEDYTKGLTALYQKRNPQIQQIQWELVDRSVYEEYLRVHLASQDLPDIIGLKDPSSILQWKDQLEILDTDAQQGIPDQYTADGRLGGYVYAVPVILEAQGILYNSQLLKQAGWDRIPKTNQEFALLCRDLEEADIKPVINHYKEAFLGMEDPLFTHPSVLKGGESGWNAFADFLDLTRLYGNQNGLTTASDTAQDYFFIKRYAVLNNEGSWLAPVIKKNAPDLEEQIWFGPVLLDEQEDLNCIQVNRLFLAVSNRSTHSEEAKKFLKWLTCSKEAETYLKQMGCLPVSDLGTESAAGLSPMAREVKAAVRSGRIVWAESDHLPAELKKQIIQLWGRYLSGELDRERVLAGLRSLWKEYMYN